MKRYLIILCGLIISTNVLAQVPQGISHQAVIRDANNQLVANSTIGIQVSILHGGVDGEAVYVETHVLISNDSGLITYIIGDGEIQSGVFAEIDWSAGPYFLKTEADPAGGMDYSITGVTQFLSVPYALYSEFAKYAETFTGLDELLARIEALEAALDIDVPGPGNVTDIDGNVYQTVIIGDQEWMAENLRVSKYNNGEAIPTGLGNTEWGNTTEGAYAIYDHNASDTDGINSPEEMLAAYGKLYNWYAVTDSRGLCPIGWSVPNDDDWTQLVNYVVAHGFPNSNVVNGAGNALKSCRQVDSPMGGDCNKSTHPRWNSHDTYYGFDEFDFSALPAGYRFSIGSFANVGFLGLWWSATEFSDANAWFRGMVSLSGSVSRNENSKRYGCSVRCVREVTDETTSYNLLTLSANPEEGGEVFGAGEYLAGEMVEIDAVASNGWEFLHWSGDADFVGDPNSENTIVTMPEQNIWLTANFQNILCDDGNLCTIGYLDLVSGECVYVPVDCDDGNPCTDNHCDPASGCVTTYNNNPCDDGNACTTNNICVDGVCTGTPIDCDDGNPCTENYCDPQTGCYHVDIPDCVP